MAVARTGAAAPSQTRTPALLTSALAAAALALGGLAVPAAVAADAPSASVLLDAEPDESRTFAPERAPELVKDGAVRLDATPTLQDGVSAPTRKPQVIKRTGKLYMSTVPDAGSVPDEQYLQDVELVQDVKAKKIVITADFYAPPTSDLNSFLDIYIGHWDSKEENCSAKARVAALAIGASSDALFLKSGTTDAIGSASRSLSGTVLTVTASGDGAGVGTYDCIYGYLDGVVSDTELKPLRRAWAEDFRPEYEMAPEFDFYSSALHAAYPGKWNKVRINVENDGNLTAKKVKVKLSGKGLKFKKKTISLGTIKPGKDKDAVVQVRLKGKKTRTLKAKATAAGSWSAKTSTKVGYRPNPKKLKTLKGMSYWAAPYEANTGWNVHGLTFVNSTWVYQGVPPKGTPKCSSKVKKCKKYSYSASSGALKIGKMRAKVDSEGIKVTKVAKKGDKKMFFTPLKSPKKNSRIKAKLTYNDFNGCGVTFSCSTWTQHLTLKKNKKFSWSYSAIHSSGIPPFQTFVSITRPTKKGTYKVLSKSRIQFTYVDAETGKRKKEIHTIGIDSNELGKHSPKYGLLIGGKPHL